MLAGLVRIGTITSRVGNRVTVQCGDNTTPAIPWMPSAADGKRRAWRPPQPGAQTVVLSMSGDTAQAIAIGVLYQDGADAPADSDDLDVIQYADGTVVQYDQASHALTATIGGTSIKADGSRIALAAGGCSITIDASGVTIVGKVTGDRDIVAGTISLQKHAHMEQGDGARVGPPLP